MMPPESPRSNVHVALKHCLLPTCNRTFTPKRKGGKPQKFCSPECRKFYFKKTKEMGKAPMSILKELEG